jgi:outer membrane lipoprotein carrier protein
VAFAAAAVIFGVVVAISPCGGRAAVIASAGSSSTDALVERLQHHYQTTQSFKADFKETLTRPGAPPQVRIGTVCYERPGRMRWNFGEPQPETIVSDGRMIYDYDPGLNQVVETPLKQAFKTQAAAAFILGAGNLRRDFNVSPVAGAPSDGLEHLLLRPKTDGQPVAIGVEPATLNIASITIADAMGNKTALSFTDLRRDVALKRSLFTFAPPPGADIVSPEGTQ